MLLSMSIETQIPEYPESRAIDLSDKQQLDRIFSVLHPRISEFSFAGLYLFRKPHDYRLTMVGDSLTVLGRGYDGAPRFLPPFTGDTPSALKLLFADRLCLYGADELFRDAYLQDSRLLLTEDRDSFDYLYLRSDLAELSGNRFHKKKNRLNYFSARHSHCVELLCDRHLEGCLKLIDDWTQAREGTESPSLLHEAESAAEAVRLAGKLGLEGVVVLVDGEVKAFALGERLNPTTSVCHFEKSDPFMEGIAQLADREFNRLLFTECTWVNREQDLGEPGLRAAKLSYHPVELVKKFRAIPLL